MIVLRNKTKIFSLIFVLSLFGCVQFKTVSLYDGYEPVVKPLKPKDLSVVVETLIFDEEDTNVWGLEDDDPALEKCQNGSISTEVAYSGKKSIKLDWNRDAPGCKWSGIGIGWDNWAGKDLSPVMEYAAIQFYARTQ